MDKSDFSFVKISVIYVVSSGGLLSIELCICVCIVDSILTDQNYVLWINPLKWQNVMIVTSTAEGKLVRSE